MCIRDRANAIFPNTTSTFILKQRGIDWEDFQSKLQLNSTELEAVKSLSMVKGKYSELFYMQDMHRSVLRLSSDKLAYWICTTDPKDKQTIENVKQQFPQKNMLQVLEHIVSEDFNTQKQHKEKN